MEQKYHNIGIIGFGSRGQNLAETIISELPEYGRVVAVAETRENPVFPANISTRCPELRVYKDYRDMLAHSDVDTIIITTYPGTHKQIVIDALKAGKAVLCDKPVVPNLTEAEELYRFVKANKCVFQVGLNLPSFPVPLKLKELLDKETIGRVVCVRGACDVGIGFGRNVILNKFAGIREGLVLGKLTHDTDLMQYLLSSYAEEVWGNTSNFRWRRHGDGAGSDDTAVIAGVCNNGTLFTQTLTSTGSSYGRKFHFFGIKGEILADLHSEEIKIIANNGDTQTIPAKNTNGGGHHGSDKHMLCSFLDYVDSGVIEARWPERILSSVMVPLAALSGSSVKTGEWFRRITKQP